MKEEIGFAFPSNNDMSKEYYWINKGMTLRDYFAGQALAGWLASYGMGDVPVPDKIATFAGEIADAMLREREKASES